MNSRRPKCYLRQREYLERGFAAEDGDVEILTKPYKPGQTLIVKINGVPTEAKVRAVLDSTEGVKLIVDFGFTQTATIQERDVVRD